MKSSSASLLIVLICIPIFIGALDLTVISAVLPHVVYDLEIPLQSGLDDAAWLVSGYLLAYSIAVAVMGRFSDLAGRRLTYLAALAIFALGSYWVAVADQWPSRLLWQIIFLLTQDRVDPARMALNVMIAARMIQAFGGGAMVPVGMALAGDLFSPEKVARPLGLIAAVDTAGWVVGHLYGGVLTRFFDWRIIFWLNLPVCALAFLLIAITSFRSVQEPSWSLGASYFFKKGEGNISPQLKGRRRMDWLGAFLVAACLFCLNLGLGSSPELSSSFLSSRNQPWWPNAVPWLMLSVFLILLFIWRQAAYPFPLIPLSLFRRLNFSPALGANLLIGFSLFIAIANVPVFINTLVAETLQQGAWDSGWLLSALTIPMALASLPGGWMTVRSGYRLPAVAGILLAFIGFLLMSTWKASTPYLQMFPHLMLTGVGFGLTMAPVAAAVLNTSPSKDRGAASALVIVARLVGMTTSVSALASYGVRRADSLSLQWSANSREVSDLIQMGMRIAEQVIHETFWIAALICMLALIPILLIKNYEKGIQYE